MTVLHMGFFKPVPASGLFFFFFNQEQNIDLSIFCAENVVSSQLSLLFLVPWELFKPVLT